MSIPSIYSSLNAQKDLKEICIQVPSSMLRTNEIGQKFIECVGRETDAKIAEMVKCMAKDVPQKTFENVLSNIPSVGGLGTVSSLVNNVQTEAVRREVKKVGKDVKKVLELTEELSVNVDKLTQGMSVVQNLSFLNVGLSAANLGVSAVGFAVVNKKLNQLSADLQEVRRNTEDIKKTQLLEVVNKGSDLIHQAEELFQYLSDQECDMQRFNAVLRAYQSYFEFVQSLMNESILDYESGYQLIMNLLRSYTEILKNYIVEYAYTHNGKLPNICDSYIQTILSFAEPQFTEPLFDYIYLNNNLSKMDAKNSLLSHLLLVGNARIRIEDTRYLVSQIPEKEGYLKLQNSIEEYNTKRLRSALSAQ